MISDYRQNMVHHRKPSLTQPALEKAPMPINVATIGNIVSWRRFTRYIFFLRFYCSQKALPYELQSGVHMLFQQFSYQAT